MTRAQTVVCIITLVLAMTCSQVYMVLHDDWLSGPTSSLAHFVLSFLIALLIERDRKIRGRSAPFEYAAFMFFAWPILAPHYLFTVMRWRGLLIGFGLLLLAITPDLAAYLTYQLQP